MMPALSTVGQHLHEEEDNLAGDVATDTVDVLRQV
jgi:hypothetical protein